MDHLMQDSQDYLPDASLVVETTEVDELVHTGSQAFGPTPHGALDSQSRVSVKSPEQIVSVPHRGSKYNNNTDPDQYERNENNEYRYAGVLVPGPRFKPLPYATSKSALIFDPRMRYHMDQNTSDDDAHPEKPQRIFEIYRELEAAGLLEDEDEEDEDPDGPFKLSRISAREADDDEILLVHSREHLEFVRESENVSLSEIKRRTEVGEGESSIYWHNLTFLCASLAAGGAIEAARAVAFNVVRNAIAIIRPPGHHAEHDRPSGFCFFDNVAIATRVVQEESKNFRKPTRRVLVLDWDVHHGNGVQQAFYDNPNVLYISLHVHQGGAFYPHGNYGDHLHWGSGAAEGKNVNIPWATQGMRDADYLLALQQVVMPIALEFNPDLVMISAGFDAAADDPLGQCFVTPAGYSHMTHMLMQLARGKVVACLEGGYNLRSTAVSALAMTRTLMGEPPQRIEELAPTPSAIQTIQTVIQTQAQFWRCLHPKVRAIRQVRELQSERLHDVIRTWQSKVLWDNYGMSEMTIRRKKISKSCQDQVLATPNYFEKRPLLVIFHDPPELLGVSDPQTSQFEMHNTFITDVCKTYVDWAVRNDFAVIDVNVPKHYTNGNDENPAVVGASLEQRTADCLELAEYLWNNYIEVGDSTHVFFMGIGDAYHGLANLYKAKHRVLVQMDASIGFICNNTLRSVSDPDDDRVSRTYYHKSLLFVSEDHPCWDPTEKKPKRRHGHLVKSEKNRLQEMLHAHRERVWAYFEAQTAVWREEQGVKEVHTESSMTTKKRPRPWSLDGAMDVQENFGDGLIDNDGFISQVQPPNLVRDAATPPIGFFPTTPNK